MRLPVGAACRFSRLGIVTSLLMTGTDREHGKSSQSRYRGIFSVRLGCSGIHDVPVQREQSNKYLHRFCLTPSGVYHQDI